MQKSFSQDIENDIISFESCSYNSNINGLEIPKQAKMVANYIAWFLTINGKENKTISYKQITDKCLEKYNEFIKHSDSSSRYETKKNLYAKYSVGDCLGIVNDFLATYGLPFISAIVIAKDDSTNEIPKKGFFKCLWGYKEIYKYESLLYVGKEEVENLSDYEKRAIVDDIKVKIERDFDKIIDAFKKLNDKRFFCDYTENEKNNNSFQQENLLVSEIQSEEYKQTEKEAIVKIRIGQSQLRTEKLMQNDCCEICGIKTKELLVVSHIKPWCESDNIEKLDVENTLLFCPIHDALFDKGFITFDARGRIKISEKLDEMEQALLNINDDSNISVLSNEKARYLNYHSQNIFLDNKK